MAIVRHNDRQTEKMVAAEVLSGCRQSDTHSNTNVTKSAVTMDGQIAGSREEVYKNERMKKERKNESTRCACQQKLPALIQTVQQWHYELLCKAKALCGQ